MKKLHSIIRRLVLAKKLYIHGYHHSFMRDDISRMLAIHNFDNTIELILKILADESKEKYDSYKTSFFNLLKFAQKFYEKQTHTKSLPSESEIVQLHLIRNTIQHTGTVPDTTTINRFRDVIESFLKDIAKNAFNLNLEELSLSLLINNPEIRESIKDTENFLGQKKYKECILKCDEVLTKVTFEIGGVLSKAGMLTGYWGLQKYNEMINKNYSNRYKKDRLLYGLVSDISQSFLDIGKASTSMQFLDWYRVDFLKHREIIDKINQKIKISNKELKDQAFLSLEFVINLILKWQEEGIL